MATLPLEVWQVSLKENHSSERVFITEMCRSSFGNFTCDIKQKRLFFSREEKKPVDIEF